VNRILRQLAWGSLAVHAVLIAVSILAFLFVIGRPPLAGIDPYLWSRAYDLGMRWTGPLYIVSGFLAALFGLMASAGRAVGFGVMVAVVILSLGMELLGTFTGLPFGPYGYGSQLGPKVLDLVPVVIPLSWFFMLYASYGVAYRLGGGFLRVAVIASLGLVAWDVLMDPTMSAVFPFWSWHVGGIYYGMPLINWFGWFVTGLLIAAAAQAIGRGRLEPLGEETLPIWLYALNGRFPLALALQARLGGVVIAGAAAMLLFLVSPWVSRWWAARERVALGGR
jgi:putative membrane protein